MKFGLLIVLLLAGKGFLFSQLLSYSVSFPNIVHHEAEITLTATGILHNPVFRMSRSSPGRYATHEFAKNIYNVTAVDKNGTPLLINQLDGDVFEVSANSDCIKMRYTLYANFADGTYADIDDAAILLNMPASFMWMKGAEKWPVSLQFNMPAGKRWNIATQLKPGADSTSFTAPGLQYFMDSPVLMGDLFWHQWKVSNPGGKSFEFRLALNAGLKPAPSQQMLAAFGNDLEKLVQEAMAVYTEVPDFDYGTYTFLASINPYVKNDGMEHRNSTIITIGSAFNTSAQLYATFAHEFFHCWNVERIRPVTLEPFNFEKSNMSDALWFAEGFTQYYGELIAHRAGFSSSDNFLIHVANWINAKNNTVAAKLYSPVQMSRKAVFTDAGVSVDRNNYANNFISYYYYGAAIALALELELRTKFNRSLDEWMLAVWNAFGKTGTAYTLPALQKTLTELTNKSFAESFFIKYVYGHEPYNYNEATQLLGCQVKLLNENKAWIGNVELKDSPQGMLVNSNTVIGTPLYEAGIDYGDHLISINNTPSKNSNAFYGLLESFNPGNQASIVYDHRGQQKTSTFRIGENPAVKVVTNEALGLPVSPEMMQKQTLWLESNIK